MTQECKGMTQECKGITQGCKGITQECKGTSEECNGMKQPRKARMTGQVTPANALESLQMNGQQGTADPAQLSECCLCKGPWVKQQVV